ncbi:NAD(P)-dependent oxidoreductase [Microbacterium sp. ET2]|uniref:NAD(P)-dependent oxidoreductase n=1 Tax=Microbacterium albipurpureum TaxID=3050384 RepID=UPI00259CB7A2|nr:NAD(P)-dependent oxidoreductase [Microbacterium sp. ET2 (Ac-2212)]WJL96903.1 NAD(P)-dependent oxidoreductase [Microbacterium sp. ET2 (Ac-2212)]
MRVGFIGLGDIGMPMAQRLVDSGFDVVGSDLSEDKCAQLRKEGASIATSLDDFSDCAVVGLAVPDDQTVESLLVEDGLVRVLSSASVLIHSTVLPVTVDKLAEMSADGGVRVSDAPVSGGAARARDGSLTIMVGGEPTPDAQKYLDALGTTVKCGRPGAGAAVKLANQLSMLAALEALYEGLALTDAYDVDPGVVLKTLQTSTGDSWTARNWGFFDDLAANYDRAGVEVRYRPWSKDLWDVVAAARAAGTSAPLAALLSQTLADAVERHAQEAKGR